MATLADLAFFDDSGFHYADYPTVLDYFQSGFKAIYGEDIYLEADSKDGQLVALIAQAGYDACAMMSALTQQTSPQTAQGVILSNAVSYNGIVRREATYSTCDVDIGGTVGTVITNGLVTDTESGLQWALPASVTIPVSGSITVTATCTTAGANTANIGALSRISTPIRGWLTVNNTAAATSGVNEETDAELRTRQRGSTMIPSQNVMDGILSAVNDVAGITRLKGYENDTGSTDSNGLAAHKIAIVVEGGDVQDIVDAIGVKKGLGTGTQGTTSGTYTDSHGVSKTINFYRPNTVTIGVQITATALTGYTSSYADQIKQAISDYINSLDIGDDVLITKLYSPANLSGVAGLTYDITDIQIKKNAGAFGSSNIAIAYTEAAYCDLTDISVNVS